MEVACRGVCTTLVYLDSFSGLGFFGVGTGKRRIAIFSYNDTAHLSLHSAREGLL